MTERKYYPHFAVWELTNRCNAKCIHCGSVSGESRENELSREEALQLCTDLKTLGCKLVGIIGGEFFLCPHWEDVVRKLHELEIRVALLTNGILINEKNVNKLKDLGIKHLAVSIDGIAKTHDQIRGVPGLFDKLMKNIKLAMDMGLQIGINTAVSGLNIHEIPQLYELFIEMGINSWQIQCVEDFGRANKNEALSITREQLYNLIKFAAKIRKEKKMKVDIADNIGHYTSIEPLIRDHPFRGCPGGKFNVGIGASGNIRGCLSVRNDENIEGNIRERSLIEIWNDPNSFANYRQRTPEKLTGFCGECKYAKYCLGGCSAMNYSLTGTFLENPMCLRKYEAEMETNGEALSS